MWLQNFVTFGHKTLLGSPTANREHRPVANSVWDLKKMVTQYVNAPY